MKPPTPFLPNDEGKFTVGDCVELVSPISLVAAGGLIESGEIGTITRILSSPPDAVYYITFEDGRVFGVFGHRLKKRPNITAEQWEQVRCGLEKLAR